MRRSTAYITKLVTVLIPYGLYSYFVMFSLLLAGGFGFPLPEDVVLITGGILSSLHICNFWITLAVCMSGVLIGDTTMFLIGRKMGPRIRANCVLSRLLTEKNNRRIMEAFEKYGDKVLFMARFMPGLRAPIFMSAGMYHVPWWKFFTFDGGAALISVPLWIYLGYLFGANLGELERWVHKFQFGIYSVIGFIVAVALIICITKRVCVKKNGKTETFSSEELNP